MNPADFKNEFEKFISSNVVGKGKLSCYSEKRTVRFGYELNWSGKKKKYFLDSCGLHEWKERRKYSYFHLDDYAFYKIKTLDDFIGYFEDRIEISTLLNSVTRNSTKTECVINSPENTKNFMSLEQAVYCKLRATSTKIRMINHAQ